MSRQDAAYWRAYRQGQRGSRCGIPGGDDVLIRLCCTRCNNTLVLKAEGGTRHERRAALVCPCCHDQHVLTVRLASLSELPT